ncbi:GNAT family N-acetyltransferase [Candidatus Woesearchaeota archaeon]|nr:GNAT family N-acetyltransferase [Candidatus Woesearchaeota archaeon]
MELEIAKKTDIEELKQICNEFSKQEEDDLNIKDKIKNPYNTKKGIEFIQTYITKRNRTVFIIRNKKKNIVAFLFAKINPPKFNSKKPIKADLTMMYVKAHYRSKGLGKQLTDEFKVWANKKGADKLNVTLWTHNKKADKFYRREGFKTSTTTLEMNS